ncbi:MAG: hypothetical protein WA399_06340 [Acidobacteriaceae bacterium]
MPIRKPKTFTVDDYTVTVDAEDFRRVQPFIPLMRATAAPVVFLVNHGSKERPAYQPLTAFIAQASMTEYWTLKDRTDPGNHTKANLVRA